MDMVTRVQILDEADCISHTLGEGMNPIVFPPWVDSRADWVLQLGEATSLGEGKFWIQTCETPLKIWPCVISCPIAGVGKYG